MPFIWTLLFVFLLGTCNLIGISSAPGLQTMTTAIDPGFPRNISTNDPGVKNAARITVYAYNNRSNDMFLFKELEILKAMIQVVKGIKYLLITKIARTVCPKKDFYNLDTCDFQQEDPLKQNFTCYSEVWNITWLHAEKVTLLSCK